MSPFENDLPRADNGIIIFFLSYLTSELVVYGSKNKSIFPNLIGHFQLTFIMGSNKANAVL
jgi:hypothetical protein